MSFLTHAASMVGYTYVNKETTLYQLHPVMRALAHLPATEKLELFEEINRKKVERLDSSHTFDDAHIVTGDIILYQAASAAALRTEKLATVDAWLTQERNHVRVTFEYEGAATVTEGATAGPEAFTLRMHLYASHARVLEKIARYLGCVTPADILLRDTRGEKPLSRYETMHDMLLEAEGKHLFFDVKYMTAAQIRCLMQAALTQHIDEELLCNVCGKPLVDPIVHACGAMSCRNCTTKRKLCGRCGNDFSITSVQQTVPQCVLRHLGLVEEPCSICGRLFPRAQLPLHTAQCPRECPCGCGFRVPPRETRHIAVCPLRKMRCDACGALCTRTQFLTVHQLRCRHPCPNRCGSMTTGASQAAHDEMCPMKPVPCPGCNMTVPGSVLMLGKSHCSPCRLGCGAMVVAGNESVHEQRACDATEVCCPAADLSCTWRGTRRDLAEHAAACRYVAMRLALQPLLEDGTRGSAQLAQAEAENATLRARLQVLEHEDAC
eukprot:TRINITY_DN4779_c0_g1_i6.p1 TRINITY_DN4779_c0_g1~~TRINITY_DN4779_c0_g1_i6.p1  ORF type:complete len:493 (-),score=100.57 TRINITY_DN4779_c0_g1_i6:39-1517(-)